MKHICIHCNYFSTRWENFMKHLETNKHKTKIELIKKEEEIAKKEEEIIKKEKDMIKRNEENNKKIETIVVKNINNVKSFMIYFKYLIMKNRYYY